MFVLLKARRAKKYLAAAAVLLACFILLSYFRQKSQTVMYEELYPDMYVQAPAEYETEQGKMAYLTFDDGPSPNTIEILDVLKEKGVKATFFVTSQDIDNFDSKQVLKRIVDEGHSIGIHTYSHKFREIYASVKNYLDDFYKIRQEIIATTGVEPKIFRYPGGSCENAYSSASMQKQIRIEMRRRGYIYYDWNVLAGDDKAYATAADTIVNNIVKGAKDKDRVIILCHDDMLRKTAAAAVGPMIDRLSEMGFSFDKITETVEPIQFTHHDYD